MSDIVDTLIDKIKQLEDRLSHLETLQVSPQPRLDVGTTGAGAGDLFTSNDIRAGGGLYVGSTGTDPGTGSITATTAVEARELRLTGTRVAPASGIGVEMGYNGTYVDLLGYDRTTPGYKNVNLNDTLTVVGGGGDVYSTALTNYTSSSTITGWSASGLTKYIAYKKIGKLVWVYYYIDGTANATGGSFTVPFSINVGINVPVPGRFFTTVLGWFWGMAELTGSTVNLYPGPGGGTWASTQQRICTGEFFYEA